MTAGATDNDIAMNDASKFKKQEATCVCERLERASKVMGEGGLWITVFFL
jgi:hypothetical protein